MEFVAVTTDAHIAEVAASAHDIWYEYWPAIIGQDQTDYMIKHFQSKEALTRDIREKAYVYWLLKKDGKILGYTGAQPEEDTGKLFISKVYLYAKERGKGYASRVIQFYEEFCRKRGFSLMYLTVNKNNHTAIRAYKAKGFVGVGALETDIGGGFIMDDYLMEKKLL